MRPTALPFDYCPMTNTYLEGNFGPVRQEVTVTELPVTGTLPDHLDGRYVRNGPNPVNDRVPATYHWFTGSGMVHGVRLREGRAEWYRNRYVRSPDVAAALGEPPRPGPVHAGLDFSANTTVIAQAGRTFAVIEGGSLPYELTYELDTIGPCDFGGTLPGGYTPHPHRDPVTGELHAVSYFFGWGNRVQYSVLGTDGRIRHTVDIECAGAPMMHDFALTEKHIVLYDLPVTFDLTGITSKREILEGDAFPYHWNPNYQARLGVLPRDGGADDVRWFELDNCYVFHGMNAYDDNGSIVLDVVRHPRMFASHLPGPNEESPTLDRWTVDLAAGKVLEERLDDRAQEFPRVDERLTGQRHRYGYSVAGKLQEGGSILYKHDFTAKREASRSFGSRAGAGEFVFVPSRAAAAEDHGVLIGYVYDGDREASDLVLVDAATLETVASVHLPVRVPYGFHGNWIPDVAD